MKKCPKCGSKNYNRIREGSQRESYTNGKLTGYKDGRTKWGYICRDCSTKWRYEGTKAALDWN